jgi:hypothetical protein
MEVTLRKAAALSQALLDASRQVNLGHTITLSIYSDTTASEAVQAAQKRLLENIEKATALMNASYRIRNAVGEANESAGVNALLREKAALDAREKLLSGIGSVDRRYGASADTLADGTLQAQLDALKERSSSATGGYRAETSLTVSVMGETVSAPIQEQLVAIRRRKVAIADTLLSINLGNKISLQDAEVALLEEYKLV